ncbi:hypothetical protein D3C74_496100 [compost metagenome]
MDMHALRGTEQQAVSLLALNQEGAIRALGARVQTFAPFCRTNPYSVNLIFAYLISIHLEGSCLSM